MFKSIPIYYKNLAIPVGTTIVFAVLFIPLHKIMGDGVSAFAIFPVALAGLYLGIGGGFIWGLLFIFLETGLFLMTGNSSVTQIFLQGGGAGLISLLGVGIASGWVRKLYEESNNKLVERNHFEVELNRSEKKYHSLFNSMSEGIAIDQIIYEDGKAVDWLIQDINPAYEKILNISRKEVVGFHASQVYGSQGIFQNLLFEYDEVAKSGISSQRKTHSLFGDREIVLTITSLGSASVAVIFTDVTEQEKAQKAEMEQRQFAEAMADILSALNSTVHLDDVLDIILNHLGKFADYDAADIMLLDQDRLRIVRHRGYSERGLDDFITNFDVPIEKILTNQRITENRQAIIVPDTFLSKSWVTIPETSWIASYLGIPIIAKDKVIGLINFSSSKRDFFKDYPIEWINPFTDQVALAIENARTFEETNQRAHRLSLINRVAFQLTQPAELEEIHQLAVDSLAEALNLEQVGLAMLYKNLDHLVLVADRPASGNTSIKGSIIPLQNNPSMDYIFENKSSFWSGDAQRDDRLVAVRDFMILQKVCSILIVPLIVGGEVIGTMGCDIMVSGRKLNQEEIDLAETLANLIAGRIYQGRLLDIQKARTNELAMLNDITLEITSTYNLSQLLEQILVRAVRLLNSSAGLFYLLDPEKEILECKISSYNRSDLVGTTLRIGEGAAGIVAQTCKPLIIPNYENWSGKATHFTDIHEPLALLSVPVIWQSKIKGVIQLIRPNGNIPYESKDADLLGLLSNQVAISLENNRLYNELQELAIHDPLTGFFNRRGFEDIGNREIERAQRFHHDFSIMFLDFDHFKTVNDRYGHPAGDQVLKNVATLCRSELRTSDIVCRYGGEEFVVLLLETDIHMANEIAERLRLSVANSPIETDAGVIHITVSIGIAQFHSEVNGLDELVHKADGALYKAKSNGRNRVCW